MSKPQRGEVWSVDLGLAAKVRPCLVINVTVFPNERALFAVIPHTTSVWSTRFEAVVPVRWLQPGAFDTQGMRPMPEKVFLRRLGALSQTEIAIVEEALLRWVGVR